MVTIMENRTAPGPVVGWPPIRSFRKNLASSSFSKLAFQSPSAVPCKVANEKTTAEPSDKGLFVKINMDGFPIEKPTRGLLQNEPCNCGS